MIIKRSPSPGKFTSPRDYHPFLRKLFRRRCAYCLTHEDDIGGEACFEVEHFRPVSRKEFAHLELEWNNLYYGCHRCNQHKANRWPTPDNIKRNQRFIDPCQDDPYEHMLISQSKQQKVGSLEGRTDPGRYTIVKINLNRKQLRDIRRRLRQREQLEHSELARCRDMLNQATEVAHNGGTPPQLQRLIKSLQNQEWRIRSRLRAIILQHPFPWN